MSKKKRLSNSQRRVKRLRKRNGFPPHLMISADEVEYGRLVTIPYSQLSDLKVDNRYQRVERKTWVNQLIRLIDSGGQMLEPIMVAVRPDGCDG
jgi:hypothetical protein